MKGFEVSNLLIVESEGDKYFIEALLNHMNLNLEIGEPICSISEYECLAENQKEVSDKIFNKFWINNYIMYDTCTSSKHKGQKSKYCIFEYAMREKDIWNFDHPILKELKDFLKELGEN